MPKNRNQHILTLPTIPKGVLWLQAICFAVLYAIWALPETILIRHICLIVGALLGLWVIYQYRSLLAHKRAIPAWLIVGLFMWATFHLFFLSNDFATQYEEFTSIWKRAVIGVIFALGFGIALISNRVSSAQNQSAKGGSSSGISMWTLVYLGLLAPTLIYIIKFILTHNVPQWGWTLPVPAYGLLYPGSAPFYLPKTAYVCFCIPTLATALGQLVRNIHKGRLIVWSNAVYLATIPAVFFVFYGENIKNGMVYGAVLLLLFLMTLLFNGFTKGWPIKLLVLAVVIGIGGWFVANNLQANDSWRTFGADAKIAFDTTQYQQWKYNGEKGYPNSELGKIVSITNYERMAWGKTGVILIAQNPLGFGLIEHSFGRLAKINWPDSKLHQSHSGWIDLTLGIGIPGVMTILISLLMVLWGLYRQAKQQGIDAQSPYRTMAWWALFSLLIMWCTTEIAQKVYFDDLIFWLSLGAGMILVPSRISAYSKSLLKNEGLR